VLHQYAAVAEARTMDEAMLSLHVERQTSDAEQIM
jgi:hypothetical protein